MFGKAKKKCLECGETKPFNDFIRELGHQDGKDYKTVTGYCKNCRKDDLRCYRAKKPCNTVTNQD